MQRPAPFRPLAVLILAALAACEVETPPDSRVTGQTDFTTVEQGGGLNPAAGGGGSGGGAGGAATPATPGPTDRAPAGRVASVEEADIYKLSGTNLFYLNTYRG